MIRRARPGEADALSALAMRSKAHWDYSPEFMERVRPELTFTEEDLTEDEIWVLDGDLRPAGMYRLLGRAPEGTLEDLWLDPEVIGTGRGRRLFDHATARAAQLGMATLLIEADPNAEGFYTAMGAHRIGESPSPSGRALPLMRIRTGGG